MARQPRQLLAHPGMPWFAAALMCVLCLPALRAGFVGDDYYHRAILLGEMDAASLDDPVRDLFRFVPAGAGGDYLRDVGVTPWWSHPDLELGFLRPVTAATHMVDHALWPNSPALQHAHSLMWFGAAVVLVGLAYRQVHGPTALAGLAVLLFAIEDAHAMPIGWLANRNAAVALVFALLSLMAHIRWRRGNAPGWLAASLTALALGLLAGEAAVGILAYIAAWQLAMDRAGWPQRLAALAPYAALLVGWRVAYDALGYGCTGSGLYIDPARQPLAFAVALVERWPVMLGGLWSQLSIDIWAPLPRTGKFVFSVLCLVVCAGATMLFVRLVRTTREGRFWALGMALSLVPVAAAFPMNRLLLFAGIGAFGLVAMLSFEVGLLGDTAQDRRPWVRRAAKTLLVLHGPAAMFLLVASVLFLQVFNVMFTAGSRFAPRDSSLADQTLVFVNGHEFPCVYTYIVRLTDKDAPAPRRIAVLGPMTTTMTLTREDDRTLVVATKDGWLEHPFDRLMRSADARFTASQRVESHDFEAVVRRLTADGRPLTVSFEFRRPLEDGSYRWVRWRRGRLEEFPLPPVGRATDLQRESLLAFE